MDCIFCKIINGEIPAKQVYEDETILAFHDVNPQAPVHILVVPKAHIAAAAALGETSAKTVGHIFAVVARLADEWGLVGGYRVVTNSGADACQTVPHLHFHVLGGKKLGEGMA